MEFERIQVATRDEYQGVQEPTAFQWRGARFAIDRVIDRWYEGYKDATRLPLRYYRVRTDGGDVFILRYHEVFMAWSMLVQRESGVEE